MDKIKNVKCIREESNYIGLGYDDFISHIKVQLKNYYRDEVDVELRHVRKNNGIILDGVSLRSRESNLAPTIYLNEYYERYRGGMSVNEILRCIIDVYERNRVEDDFDTESYTDFSRARERLAFRLINYEKNERLLREVPHRRFLDMAIVYYCVIRESSFGNATILVRNEHLNLWGRTEEDLYRASLDNSPRLLEPSLKTMARVIDDMPGAPKAHGMGEDMYVISNRLSLHGAASILYPGVLEELSDRMGGDFILIPSSVHEMIAVPMREECSPDWFGDMISSVNATSLQEEEILSDSPYLYDSWKNELGLYC